MTMLASEPAICKKCGNKQLYTKVITWNTWIDPVYPAHNVCYKCGEEITYDDIDLEKCSPSHRRKIRRNKIYESMPKENGDNRVCPKCGYDQMEHSSLIDINLPEKYKNKRRKYYIHKENYECPKCKYRCYESEEEIRKQGFFKIVEKMDEECKFIVRETIRFKLAILTDGIIRKILYKLTEYKLELKGIITTRKEEQEYSERYYKELHDRFSD